MCKDKHYKPEYHGPASNSFVEQFWKTRAAYPVNASLIMTGVGQNEPEQDSSKENSDDED